MKHLKQGVSFLCSVALLSSIAVSASAAEMETDTQTAQRTFIGRVVEVTDDEVTLELAGRNMGRDGHMSKAPMNGDMEIVPERPENEATNGEDIPHSKKPNEDPPNGETMTPSELPDSETHPDKPENERQESNLVISLDELDGADVEEGDMLRIGYNKDGVMISAEVMEFENSINKEI